MTAMLQTVALGEVASFIRGIIFKPSDVVPAETPGAVLCMRTKNVQTRLDLSDVWTVSAALVKRGDQFLQAGDTLVSSANSWNLVGKCCWIPPLDSPSSFGGFVSVLRANPSKVNPRYLYHWFSSPRIQATVRSFGQQTTNISNLNIERCLKLGIPLPPLEEQQRIAEVLDRADDLRNKRREALAHLDDLTRSIVASALADIERSSYPVQPLDDVVERITVGHVGPTSQFFREEGVPFLRTGNIGSSEIDLSDLRYVTPEFHKRLSKSTLRKGDLLVSRVISDEVRCAIVPPELDGANCANAIIIRPGSAMSGIFIQHLIASPVGQSAFLRRRVGSAQSVVNTQVLQSWQVPVPPLSVQTEFETRVSAVDGVRVRHRANLAELDALFGSLQDRAFRGLL